MDLVTIVLIVGLVLSLILAIGRRNAVAALVAAVYAVLLFGPYAP